MNNVLFKIMYLSEHEHGGGGISRTGFHSDFSDILKQVFTYLQTYVMSFTFNGIEFNFTLWQLIKFDCAIAIGIYIISKIWDISLKRSDIWV